MRKVVSGESYIELVKFTKEGVEIESIISYGSSDHKNLNILMIKWNIMPTKKQKK